MPRATLIFHPFESYSYTTITALCSSILHPSWIHFLTPSMSWASVQEMINGTVDDIIYQTVDSYT